MTKDLLPKFLIGLVIVLIIVIVVKQFGSNSQTYNVKGRITGIGPQKKVVIISHKAIGNYLKANITPFNVKDTSKVKNFKSGDAVSFLLHVRGDSTWIDNLHQIADSLVSKNPAGKKSLYKKIPKSERRKNNKEDTLSYHS